DDGSGFTMSPSTIYEAGEQNMFAVETWDWTVGTLRLSKITGAVGAEVLTEGIAFPPLSKPWDFPTSADQGGGTGNTIVTGDVWRPMSLVYRNGFLWGVSCVGPLDGVAPRASAQWFELDLAGNVIQNGRIDDPTSAAPKFYYYPSIAVNQTNDVV